MSLQRRLMIYLLVCAPLVWAVALLVSVNRVRHEVNELFDTQLIRLAHQVQSTMVPSLPPEGAELTKLPHLGDPRSGEGDVHDLAVAVWNAGGKLLIADREGVQLPYRPDAVGFADITLGGTSWRVYYLQSFSGDVLVAAGQGAYERDEVVFALIASQLVPWLLVLPVLLLAMGWAVRRALAPIRELTGDLQGREAGNLQPVPAAQAPEELKPLVGAMNSLFGRIQELLMRERRFTADAAHELRTPLAVLRAQWDVVKRSEGQADRIHAQARMDAGIERMDRLVTQMLALSRADAATESGLRTELAWPPIVEQAMSDCLPMAQRRDVELACEWPPEGVRPMPLMGDGHLMTVLLRNLLDNAVRYAPAGTAVTLRLCSEHLEVDNEGEPLSQDQLSSMGRRFHRLAGQEESGSGLGISIVQRIAMLHGLHVWFTTLAGGTGVRVVVGFAPAPPTST